LLLQFAEAYTLAGCADPAHCGLFRRVLARCTSAARCGTDPTLCAGVPAYQKDGDEGPVLFRWEESDGTFWFVADSTALDTCDGSSWYLLSALNDQPGPPTAPAYSTGDNGQGGTGWIDTDASPWGFGGFLGSMCTGGFWLDAERVFELFLEKQAQSNLCD
jgi:hypothetical protein